jgi:hypothetical protein
MMSKVRSFTHPVSFKTVLYFLTYNSEKPSIVPLEDGPDGPKYIVVRR